MAPSATTTEPIPLPPSKQLIPKSKDDPTKEKTALQAISQGVCLPGIPLFSSYDKHRAWILSHMAGAFRVFARKGFTEAGKAWSAFGRPLEMINQDVTYFYGDAQAVYEDFGGVVLSEAEGKKLAAALGPKGKGLILQNHGLLTVGGTVDEAAYLYTLMEKSCEVQLKVEAAAANGLPKKIVDDEAAAYTFKMASDPEALYWEFQPDLEYEYEMSGGIFEK
ncbi:hypothetical protein GRF29_69g420499 [Pseudopithomyces chartarum]|uniref:Class II aldolase/adducin N-terminal domain-containing protein n=1 Tax=Pseudopithomyces chartarum TaxID=1892770 RepID=A0AAN6LXK0_9PLEO|nr:hypothetical protein GRF29_69g420499 [Pseudopithomyces chartarum]